MRDQITLIVRIPRLSLKVLGKMDRHAGCPSRGSQIPVLRAAPIHIKSGNRRETSAIAAESRCNTVRSCVVSTIASAPGERTVFVRTISENAMARASGVVTALSVPTASDGAQPSMKISDRAMKWRIGRCYSSYSKHDAVPRCCCANRGQPQ